MYMYIHDLCAFLGSFLVLFPILHDSIVTWAQVAVAHDLDG